LKKPVNVLSLFFRSKLCF